MQYQTLASQALKLSQILEYLEQNPDSSEPYYLLCKYYRLDGDNDSAMDFLELSLRLNKYSQMAKHSNFEEMTILGFYTNRKEIGHMACEKLRFSRTPGVNRDLAFSNQFYYIQAWKEFSRHKLEIEYPAVENPKGENKLYRPLNPSIVTHDGRYFINVRTVNFINDRCISYTSMDVDGIIRTRNFLVECIEDFTVVAQNELIEVNDRVRYPHSVIGMEDIRLFNWNNQWWGTTSIMDSLPFFSPKIHLFHSDDNFQVREIIKLRGSNNEGQCEKNWLPFVQDNEVYVIYSWDPFQLKKPNLETGECPIIKEYKCSLNLKTFRGSAGPLKYKDGYLAVIHEVIFSSQRHYHHRFVYLDADFNITGVTLPFYFINRDIEYCCGLAWALNGEDLILSMGIGDCQAYLITIQSDLVDQRLLPLDVFSI